MLRVPLALLQRFVKEEVLVCGIVRDIKRIGNKWRVTLVDVTGEGEVRADYIGNISVCDIIRVVGRVAEEDRVFVQATNIRPVNDLYFVFHMLSIMLSFDLSSFSIEYEIESIKDKILRVLVSVGRPLSVEEISSMTLIDRKYVDKAIEELLNQGLIVEIEPGKYQAI